MAPKPLPSPEVLRQLLRYEPETGKLFWLARSPKWFPSGHRTQDGNAANWNSKYAGREAFTADNGHGYLQGRVFAKSLLAHRVIWAMSTGAWPLAEIDHADNDPKNNRLSNLREATRAENEANKPIAARNKSGLRGVCFDPIRQKWVAQIGVNRRTIPLGRFSSADEAAAAYAKASAELHGEFGRVA